jgi:hypothetical protein
LSDNQISTCCIPVMNNWAEVTWYKKVREIYIFEMTNMVCPHSQSRDNRTASILPGSYTLSSISNSTFTYHLSTILVTLQIWDMEQV